MKADSFGILSAIFKNSSRTPLLSAPWTKFGPEKLTNTKIVLFTLFYLVTLYLELYFKLFRSEFLMSRKNQTLQLHSHTHFLYYNLEIDIHRALWSPVMAKHFALLWRNSRRPNLRHRCPIFQNVLRCILTTVVFHIGHNFFRYLLMPFFRRILLSICAHFTFLWCVKCTCLLSKRQLYLLL